MLLYKGVLHGIVQGTSSRPVAAAAVHIILHKAQHASSLFLIRCLKNINQHLPLSFPKSPWMCRRKTRLNFNCNPAKRVFRESRPPTSSADLSWAFGCFLSSSVLIDESQSLVGVGEIFFDKFLCQTANYSLAPSIYEASSVAIYSYLTLPCTFTLSSGRFYFVSACVNFLFHFILYYSCFSMC